MHQAARSGRQRLLRSLVAILASGSLFQTCETRLRDAFVTGTRDYVLSLLNPETFLELIGAEIDNMP